MPYWKCETEQLYPAEWKSNGREVTRKLKYPKTQSSHLTGGSVGIWPRSDTYIEIFGSEIDEVFASRAETRTVTEIRTKKQIK